MPIEDEAALGLERAGNVTDVYLVEQTLGEYPDDGWPDDAFDRSGVVADG